MERGWIKLHRKILDSVVFADAHLLQVFVWAIMKATHKKSFVPMKTGKGNTIVEIGPGQFIFGRKVAGIELGMPPSSVYDRIKKLKKLKILDIQPDTHYSIVTVCNYDRYQVKEDIDKQANRQPTDNQPTTNRQPTDTYKNNKNVKNDKKESKSPASAKPSVVALIMDAVDNIDFTLTDLFVDYLRENIPKAKIPEKLAKWHNSMRLMRERDNHTPDEIEAVIFSLTKENVWWTETGNMQSVPKLREKFPQLHTKMTSKPTKKITGHQAFIDSLSPSEVTAIDVTPKTKRIGEWK